MKPELVTDDRVDIMFMPQDTGGFAKPGWRRGHAFSVGLKIGKYFSDFIHYCLPRGQKFGDTPRAVFIGFVNWDPLNPLLGLRAIAKAQKT